jgi:hypothetical protein
MAHAATAATLLSWDVFCGLVGNARSPYARTRRSVTHKPKAKGTWEFQLHDTPNAQAHSHYHNPNPNPKTKTSTNTNTKAKAHHRNQETESHKPQARKRKPHSAYAAYA